MATTLADALIGILAEKAVQRVTEEATLVVNFRNDIEWLTKKLTTMRDYLQDADCKSTNNELVRKWVHTVRDIAWDAEDMLEECAVESIYNESCTVCICNEMILGFKKLIFNYKMGRRIKEVRDKMESVMQDAMDLKLVRDLSLSDQPSASSSQNIRWRRSSIVEKDSPPVAIEPKVQQILPLLDDATIPVIAVVGMGGVGKTFLLQHVFNRIKERYDNSIWLSISQTYSLRKLQSDLASYIKLAEIAEDGVNKMKRKLKEVVRGGGISEIRAAEIIHGCLEGKRTLVVLDDVWRATSQENLIEGLGLPTGDNSQCKIVVTTRSREVCRNMRAHVHEMEHLSEEDSWELFCFHAFPKQNGPPQYLEKIARGIEKECGNLPLAIKTVAASLAMTNGASREWEVKLRQLKEVANRNDPILEILKLSYDSLSTPLKPCFAYLSFFPEDMKIDCQYLINLWIAEGFIPQVEDQWEVGWDYLYQLETVCFVNLQGTRREMESCTVHDLVLDLAISISKENNCAFSVEEAFSKLPNRCGCRRILLPKKGIDSNVMATSSVCYPEFLRSLSLSENEIVNIPASFFAKIRVMRVLDLSHTNISTLPTCIGNLKLLRVLNLSETKIEKVPECIRRLKCLRFLDISGCKGVRRLPVWIGELQFLQQLNVRDCSNEMASFMPKGISKLLSLRILRSEDLRLSIEENGVLKVEDVAGLIHLQELRLSIEHDVQLQSIGGGDLDQLVNMRILHISNEIPQSGSVDLQCIPERFTAMSDLEELVLNKFAVPSWVCGCTNLKRLTLVDCDGSNYSALERLPNLTDLWLMGNKSCRELPKAFGKSGAFPRLEVLSIISFPLLEEFPELEGGAMPRLQELIVWYCPIKNAPIGLEHLKSLKVCQFADVGGDVGRELKEGGEYRKRIEANIPHVVIQVRAREEE